MTTAICNHCGTLLNVGALALGDPVECGRCGKRFQIQALTVEQPKPLPSIVAKSHERDSLQTTAAIAFTDSFATFAENLFTAAMWIGGFAFGITEVVVLLSCVRDGATLSGWWLTVPPVAFLFYWLSLRLTCGFIIVVCHMADAILRDRQR